MRFTYPQCTARSTSGYLRISTFFEISLQFPLKSPPTQHSVYWRWGIAKVYKLHIRVLRGRINYEQPWFDLVTRAPALTKAWNIGDSDGDGGDFRKSNIIQQVFRNGKCSKPLSERECV